MDDLFFDDDDFDVSMESFIGSDNTTANTDNYNNENVSISEPLQTYAIYKLQLSIGDLVKLANQINTENTKLDYIKQFDSLYCEYGNIYQPLLNNILDTLTEEHLVCVAHTGKIRFLISAVYPHTIYVDASEYTKDDKVQTEWKTILIKKSIYELHEISMKLADIIVCNYPESEDAVIINSMGDSAPKNVDELSALESTVLMSDIMSIATEAGDPNDDINSGLKGISKIDKKSKSKNAKSKKDDTDSSDDDDVSKDTKSSGKTKSSDDIGDDTDGEESDDNDTDSDNDEVVDIASQTSDELDGDDTADDVNPDDFMGDADGKDDTADDTSTDDTSDDSADQTDSSGDTTVDDPIKSIETKSTYRDRFIHLYDVVSDSMTSLEKYSPTYNITPSEDFYKIKTNLSDLSDAIYKLVTIEIHKLTVPELMCKYKISNDIFDLNTRLLEEFMTKYKKESDKINKSKYKTNKTST